MMTFGLHMEGHVQIQVKCKIIQIKQNKYKCKYYISCYLTMPPQNNQVAVDHGPIPKVII